MTDATVSTSSLASPVVGSSIGTWVRDTGVANWNRFAAVNDEFMPIHMDDEAARAAGLPGAIGMGNLVLSYLHGLVRSWTGDHGHIERLSVRFRRPNTKGRITATGTVTGVVASAAITQVEIELHVVDAAGDDIAPGSATVALYHRAEA